MSSNGLRRFFASGQAPSRQRISPLGRVVEQLEAREVPAAITLQNPTDLTVDGSASSVSVTYFPGTHFANGAPVQDVNVTITFQKDDLNAGQPFNNEVHYSLTGPNGQTVELIPAGMWGGIEGEEGEEESEGQVSAGTVTMMFDDAAKKQVAATTQPTTGTFRPFQALNAFNGSSANGTWTLNIEDTVGIDPLYHFDVQITVTARGSRFDMKASSGAAAVDGWEKAWQGTKYSTATGFGWSAASSVGGAANGALPDDSDKRGLGHGYAPPEVLVDYAYGAAPATFQVFVGAFQFANVTIYSYGTAAQGTIGPGVAARIGNGPISTLLQNGVMTIEGQAGADGILNITFSRRIGAGLWVVSAIGVDAGGQG